MSISHHAYFEQVLKRVEAIDPDVTAAVVSSAGLVLLSNVADAHREAQLASHASTYLDYGRKMFAAGPKSPDQKSGDDVQSIITVGQTHFVLVVHLVAGAMLVTSGTDKAKISTFLKMAMDEVNHINELMSTREIFF